MTSNLQSRYRKSRIPNCLGSTRPITDPKALLTPRGVHDAVIGRGSGGRQQVTEMRRAVCLKPRARGQGQHFWAAGNRSYVGMMCQLLSFRIRWGRNFSGKIPDSLQLTAQNVKHCAKSVSGLQTACGICRGAILAPLIGTHISKCFPWALTARPRPRFHGHAHASEQDVRPMRRSCRDGGRRTRAPFS